MKLTSGLWTGGFLDRFPEACFLYRGKKVRLLYPCSAYMIRTGFGVLSRICFIYYYCVHASDDMEQHRGISAWRVVTSIGSFLAYTDAVDVLWIGIILRGLVAPFAIRVD